MRGFTLQTEGLDSGGAVGGEGLREGRGQSQEPGGGSEWYGARVGSEWGDMTWPFGHRER